MTEKPIFDILMLLARPAAGKSEVIDYLKRTPEDQRISRFHVGNISEIDDFPMLWAWFEEDALLEKMGYPHVYTDRQGYFLGNHLWDLLIERICLEFTKLQVRTKGVHAGTTLIEFSRGTEHGGFSRAFEHLSHEVLVRTNILFLQVSWEESLRKNRKRFNPEQPDSILEHSLSDEKMERLYKGSDWADLTANSPDYLRIQGVQVPYVVTTPRGEELGRRLETCLSRLYNLRQAIK